MTLTFEVDLDSVKMNQLAKYLGQRSSNSKVIVRIDTHAEPIALAGPLKWSVIKASLNASRVTGW